MTPLIRSDTRSDTRARTGARPTTPTHTRSRSREADAMAVTGFVLGLVGLLVMNLILGPTAVVLGALALRRRTTRPGRARLGIALGLADLAVLGCLVTADGTWSWGLA
ncbi:DUF4190 domain-containing protein [Streptomyces virginiae]|uniref:DUF4190 domain-containing protein n=1 Tax=Streptomyces virginiae TaxID=1961 RepID=UPI002250A9EB|nr:DUF4190 domain-containing protein [Streptomyces virginiae]MCX4718857.1 DUF4190 domain-containing protein [Streptomyces virginiae]MCX5276499.1 DUF4190 domain-containing protein [Streptomyces virginiae]